MSWVRWWVDLDLFTTKFSDKVLLDTFAATNQILLKNHFVHILLTFMYLVTSLSENWVVNKSKSTHCWTQLIKWQDNTNKWFQYGIDIISKNRRKSLVSCFRVCRFIGDLLSLAFEAKVCKTYQICCIIEFIRWLHKFSVITNLRICQETEFVYLFLRILNVNNNIHFHRFVIT